MATEYKLSYTAAEIDEKLGQIDNAVMFVNGVAPDEYGNVEVSDSNNTETITVLKSVEFDSVEQNMVYTKAFPTGYSLYGYNTHNKTVTPGEVYYITSMPVPNAGYGIAHFFDGDTWIATIGEYPGVTDVQTDYEVVVPDGATLMRVIPNKSYDGTLTLPIVRQWQTVTVQKDNCSNYVTFDGNTCTVMSRYNDTENIVFEINSGGGNNLPDIRKVYTVVKGETTTNRTLLNSQTDILSPHIVKAVENADGDTPSNIYFTGGNHQTNNSGSGGAATARSSGISVRCDNVTVLSEAYGNEIEVCWTNYIQGYNTSKSDGSGREVMREEVRLMIHGATINVDIRHYALEPIVRTTYYGLQFVTSAFNKLRYIGGSNRIQYTCGEASDSGNKNCRNISFTNNSGDVLEIGIENVDLGMFEYDGVSYSAFATTYGKSYFAPLCQSNFEQDTDEATVIRGSYTFTFNGR